MEGHLYQRKGNTNVNRRYIHATGDIRCRRGKFGRLEFGEIADVEAASVPSCLGTLASYLVLVSVSDALDVDPGVLIV